MTESFGPTEVEKYNIDTTRGTTPRLEPPAERDVDNFNNSSAETPDYTPPEMVSFGSTGTTEQSIYTPPEMASFGLQGEPLDFDPPANESEETRDFSNGFYAEPGLNPTEGYDPTDEGLIQLVHDRFGELTDGQYWENPNAEYLFRQATNDLQVPHPEIVRATHLYFGAQTGGQYWDYIDAANKFGTAVAQAESQAQDLYTAHLTDPPTVEDVHQFLDFLGMAPVIGEPADALNAVIYAAEGDYVNAGISGLALVPVIGSAATGARMLDRSRDLVNGLDATVTGRTVVDGNIIEEIVTPNGDVYRVIQTEEGGTYVVAGVQHQDETLDAAIDGSTTATTIPGNSYNEAYPGGSNPYDNSRTQPSGDKYHTYEIDPPTVQELRNFPDEALLDFRDTLEASLAQRHLEDIRFGGVDSGHGRQEQFERDLLQSVNKILESRGLL